MPIYRSFREESKRETAVEDINLTEKDQQLLQDADGYCHKTERGGPNSSDSYFLMPHNSAFGLWEEEDQIRVNKSAEELGV